MKNLILPALALFLFNCSQTGQKPQVHQKAPRVEKAPADSGEVISPNGDSLAATESQTDSMLVSSPEQKPEPKEPKAQDSLLQANCGINMPSEKKLIPLDKALDCVQKISGEPDVILSLLILSQPSSNNSVSLLKRDFLLGKANFALGNIKEAAEYWKKIQNQEPAINQILEDAKKNSMVSGIMSQTLPSQTMTQIERLMQAVIRGAHHPEVSKIAVDILGTQPPENIRTEIKKLVQETWERDLKKSQLEIEALKTEYQNSQNLELFQLKLANLSSEYSHLPQQPFQQAGVQNYQGPSGSSPENPEILYKNADSLVEKGMIVEALPLIAQLKGSPYENKARDLKNTAGERFCIEKRKKASEYFAAKKGQSPQKQKDLLDKAAQELENCLTYFNDIEIAKKVRKNLKMIKDQIAGLDSQ